MHKTAGPRRRRSMRRNLLFWVFLCILPILVILFACTTLVTGSFERQMRAYVEQMISPFAAEIDASLTAALRYIGSQDLDLSCMESAVPKEQLAALTDMQELGDTISASLTIYTDIDAVFLYNGSRLWFVHNTNRSYAKNAQAAEYLESLFYEEGIAEHILGEGYRSFQAGDTCYLYLASEMSDGVIGCWFEEEHLLKSIDPDEVSGLLEIALTDSDGNPLNTAAEAFTVESGIFSTQTPLDAAPVFLTAYWDESVIFSSFYSLVSVVILCLCLSCLLFAVCVFALRRSFIQPLDRLITMIRGLGKNNFAKIPVEEQTPQEVQEVVSALNIMVDEVMDLKIQVYEEQIKKQQTEMQLYQLQLRPHFLLNMLNNLISYAQVRDFAAVKKLAMFLAKHCRYILYNTWFVTVEEELDYTRNYFEMQTMKSANACRYSESCADELLEFELPILCIQIFVENSLKNAAVWGKDFEIRVSLQLESFDSGEYLCVCIDDTGPGFSAEALAAFEQTPKAPEPGAGHGIGIFNVRERLQILYGSAASVSFSNSGNGGAHVELHLPTETQRRSLS